MVNHLTTIISSCFNFSLGELSSFQLLLLKYVVGYSDLVLVPLVVILLDPHVRQGVSEVCRWESDELIYILSVDFRKKHMDRERAESSIF